MKKIAVLLFVFLPFLLNGQTYIPIPASPTSEWRVQHMYHFKTDPCLIVEDYKYYFMNDTLIKSKTYSKLYKSGIIYETPLGPNSYCDPKTYHYTDIYVGAIRNDSSKVYLHSSQNQTERLLYDFNLHIGDTLANKIFSWSGNLVVGIDTILINNRQHRRFFIGDTSTPFMDSTRFIVEGVGSSIGLIEIEHWESSHDLLCYAENNASVFPKGSYCILNIGIDELSIEQEFALKYYPNPVNSVLNLSFENNLTNEAELYIINTLGQQVYQQKLQANNYQYRIPLNKIKPGIYFFEVRSTQIRIASGKFIKN